MQLHPRLLPRKNFLPFSVDKYRIWAYTCLLYTSTYQVDVEGRTVDEVAREFLVSLGLLEA